MSTIHTRKKIHTKRTPSGTLLSSRPFKSGKKSGPVPSDVMRVQSQRSDRAIAMDRARKAAHVVDIDDPGKWLNAPNRFDIAGVDTPSGAERKVTVSLKKPTTTDVKVPMADKPVRRVTVKRVGKATKLEAPEPKKELPSKKFILNINPIGDSRFKNWAKVLTGVDTSQTTGYAFEGSFINCDRKHELEEGTHILRFGMEGSRRYATPLVSVIKLESDGTWKQIYRKADLDKNWALDVRDDIAALLKKQS